MTIEPRSSLVFCITMLSLKYSAVATLLASIVNAKQGGPLTAPKGAKVLTVGVIGGTIILGPQLYSEY